MFPSLQAMSKLAGGPGARRSMAQLAGNPATKYREDLEDRNPDFLNNVEALRAKLMGQGAMGDNPYGNQVAEEVFRPHAPAVPPPRKDFFASMEPRVSSAKTMAMGVSFPSPGMATLDNIGDPKPNEDTNWSGQTLYSDGDQSSFGSPEMPSDVATGISIPPALEANANQSQVPTRQPLPGMNAGTSLPSFNRILQQVLGGIGGMSGPMDELMGKAMDSIPGGIVSDQGGFIGQETQMQSGGYPLSPTLPLERVASAIRSPIQTAGATGEAVAQKLGGMAQGAYGMVDNNMQKILEILRGGPKLPQNFQRRSPDPYANQGRNNTMLGRMGDSSKFGL